jgi:hypothetical protein
MKSTIDMAREAGLRSAVLLAHFKSWDALCDSEQEEFDRLVSFEALVRADEREACAKVCDDLPPPERMSLDNESLWEVATLDCAEAIRNRGNT